MENIIINIIFWDINRNLSLRNENPVNDIIHLHFRTVEEEEKQWSSRGSKTEASCNSTAITVTLILEPASSGCGRNCSVCIIELKL